MRVSIAAFSFHGLREAGMMDAFGYLESVKYRYRLDAADFWNGIIGTTDEEYLKKVKQALDEREMTVANYHADGPHVWEDDPAAREKNYRDALTHLQAAALLGAQTVRIDTGGTLTPITDEQLETLANRYREYAQFGEEHGFVVGPENHWGLSLIADNMEKLAKAVDHPAYGILLHVGHWEDGDEEGGDRRLAKYAAHTHLDARITRTCLQERVQILVDAGYQGCWGVEHHSGRNEYVEVAWQLAEVQRALVHAGVK